MFTRGLHLLSTNSLLFDGFRLLSLRFCTIVAKNDERGTLVIGSQIALLRQERELRQAELAELLHISASTVGMYEQGRRLPSLDMAVRISKVFDVTIDYLLTGKNPTK